MSIEQLKTMKTQIMGCVQGQMGNLEKVDTKELGEAIDMIKDLSEAIYYCTITESMEKSEEGQPVNNITYYTTTPATYPDYRNMERSEGYMYYPPMNNRMYYSGGSSGSSGNSGGSGGNSSTSYYTEIPYEMMRDPREGRSAIRRRMYMEGKEQHKDTNSQLQELDAYLE